jgi:hypothetical protein
VRKSRFDYFDRLPTVGMHGTSRVFDNFRGGVRYKIFTEIYIKSATDINVAKESMQSFI